MFMNTGTIAASSTTVSTSIQASNSSSNKNINVNNIFSPPIGIGTTGHIHTHHNSHNSHNHSNHSSHSQPRTTTSAINSNSLFTNSNSNMNFPKSLHELKHSNQNPYQHQYQQPQMNQQQQMNQQHPQSNVNINTNINSNINSNANVNNSSAAMAAGARLLSSRGIDTSSLFQKAKTLESRIQTNATKQPNVPTNMNTTTTNTNTSSASSSSIPTPQSTIPTLNQNLNLQGTNINSTLESIRLQTITNILSKQRNIRMMKVESNIQSRLIKDWNLTKRQILRDTVLLDDNGRRIEIPLGDVGISGSGTGDNTGITDGILGSEGKSHDMNDPTSTSASNSLALATSNFSVSNDPNELDIFHNLATYHHSNLFPNANNANTVNNANVSTMLTNSLLKLSHELSISNSAYTPYYNASKLVSTLSSIVTSTASTSTGVTGVSTSTLTALVPSTLKEVATVKERTLSSLLFLSNQFREYILTKVKNSTSTTTSTTSSFGESNDGGGFIEYITKYVEMEIGHENFMFGKKDVLYKCMYYSLRCGDVHSALRLYASSRVGSGNGITGNSGGIGGGVGISGVGIGGSSGNGGVLRNVLEYLVQYTEQASGGSISNTNSNSKDERCIGLFNGLHDLPSTLIAELKDLYHHVGLNSNSTTDNEERSEYEIALLGMLSFSDISSDGGTSVATTTIEDYIYVGLWNALAPTCDMAEAVITLGEGIKSYGSDYFEDSTSTSTSVSSTGWAYAMPLLLCQCYKSGIVHLAQSGNGSGLCMGVHLAMALTNQKRIMIVDLIDEQKMINDTATAVVEQNNFVMSTLLLSYAKALQSNSPPMALEYLLHIPDTTMSRVPMKNGMKLSQKAEKQISNLLLETRAFGILAGQVSPDGSRPASGALDVHFTPSGVADLLSTAANDCTREGRITDAAELLSLAGQYSTLLSLLNRKLASLVVVTKEDGVGSEKQHQRNLWKDAAHRFHSMYLSQGHSQVIQILEAEGQLSLGLDFQMLLNLMVFFERCYEEDWNAAWELIADLDLLPTGEEAINTSVESYNNLSDEIQQIFHHIIVKSMECLSNLHSYFKSSVPDSSANVQNASEQRLFEIRNRAKCLVTFAGFIRMNYANEVRTKIGKIEAYMI